MVNITKKSRAYKLERPTSERIKKHKNCGRNRVYLRTSDGHLRLAHTFSCWLSDCPRCAAVRAYHVTESIKEQFPVVDMYSRGEVLYFGLTLTAPPVCDDWLSTTLTKLARRFTNVLRRKGIAGHSRGYFSKKEVKLLSKDKDGRPIHNAHIHVLWAVDADASYDAIRAALVDAFGEKHFYLRQLSSAEAFKYAKYLGKEWASVPDLAEPLKVPYFQHVAKKLKGRQKYIATGVFKRLLGGGYGSAKLTSSRLYHAAHIYAHDTLTDKWRTSFFDERAGLWMSIKKGRQLDVPPLPHFIEKSLTALVEQYAEAEQIEFDAAWVQVCSRLNRRHLCP